MKGLSVTIITAIQPYGIWPLPRKFRVYAEFREIPRKHWKSAATAKFRGSARNSAARGKLWALVMVLIALFMIAVFDVLTYSLLITRKSVILYTLQILHRIQLSLHFWHTTMAVTEMTSGVCQYFINYNSFICIISSHFFIFCYIWLTASACLLWPRCVGRVLWSACLCVYLSVCLSAPILPRTGSWQ